MNTPSNKPQSKPIQQMTKIEMEEAIKKYRFVLHKLHKEIADKDLEIGRLNDIINRYEKREGKSNG
jgi:hypothetical protein